MESNHDPVKHGPTRGPRFDALLRTGRQISDKYTVSFTKFYRTSKTLRGRASSWQIKSMPCSEWLKSAKLPSRRVRPGDLAKTRCAVVAAKNPTKPRASSRICTALVKHCSGRLNHGRLSQCQPWNGGNWPSSRRERSNQGT